MTPIDCTHENARLTRYTLSNNTIAIYRQCDDCGEKVGTAISRATIPNWQALPPFDVEKQDRRRAETRDFYAAKRAEWQAYFETNREERQKAYDVYLRTPEWKQIRRRALVRDDFLCQNCFCKITHSSAEVHHLTYDSLRRTGITFTFEVVSLCSACHKLYHSIEE
jgi:5-methylcytosine-specific restriction endonuclease McrA